VRLHPSGELQRIDCPTFISSGSCAFLDIFPFTVGRRLSLTGDPKAGEKVFVDNCQKCHGEQGQGGVKNPGSDDDTIPELNPIDETMVDKDSKVFATNEVCITCNKPGATSPSACLSL